MNEEVEIPQEILDEVDKEDDMSKKSFSNLSDRDLKS